MAAGVKDRVVQTTGGLKASLAAWESVRRPGEPAPERVLQAIGSLLAALETASVDDLKEGCDLPKIALQQVHAALAVALLLGAAAAERGSCSANAQLQQG